MMRRNAKAEIREAIERELDACGFPDRKTSECILTKFSQGKTMVKVSEKDYLGAAMRVALPKFFEREKPRNGKQLDATLETIRKFRFEMRPEIAKAIKLVLNAFPKKAGGRKPKLNEADEKNIAMMVETFRKNGMTRRSAIQQCIERYGIGIRTAYRICQKFGVR
jgi:hypothetical protein